MEGLFGARVAQLAVLVYKTIVFRVWPSVEPVQTREVIIAAICGSVGTLLSATKNGLILGQIGFGHTFVEIQLQELIKLCFELGDLALTEDTIAAL